VAETTQSFITFMDALKLRLRAKDQLHPLLQELMTGYSRFKASAEWQGRGKIVQWLIALNSMKASDEITDDQSRQVIHTRYFQSAVKGVMAHSPIYNHSSYLTSITHITNFSAPSGEAV
jgi:hypothetical protein